MSMVLASSCLNLLPGLDCRFADSAKHLLANVNYIRDTVLTWPLNVQWDQTRRDRKKGAAKKCGNAKKENMEQIKRPRKPAACVDLKIHGRKHMHVTWECKHVAEFLSKAERAAEVKSTLVTLLHHDIHLTAFTSYFADSYY